MKISFFDNIYYWIRSSAPKRGLPERSFFILFVSKFAYFIFFVALILHTLNDETVITLYKMEKTIVVCVVYFLLFIATVQCIVYNKTKYLVLKDKYARMSDAERQERKKIFKIYIFVSILTGIVSVILWSLYIDRVKEAVSVNLSI